MLATFAEAARVLPYSDTEKNVSPPENLYYKVATRNGDFLLSALRPNNQLVRAWHNYTATSAVFLEDYAR